MTETIFNSAGFLFALCCFFVFFLHSVYPFYFTILLLFIHFILSTWFLQHFVKKLLRVKNLPFSTNPSKRAGPNLVWAPVTKNTATLKCAKTMGRAKWLSLGLSASELNSAVTLTDCRLNIKGSIWHMVPKLLWNFFQCNVSPHSDLQSLHQLHNPDSYRKRARDIL